MRLLIYTSILFVFSFSTFASTCRLPLNKKIVIGCSYDCDGAIKTRVRAVALTLGYRVQFKNLLNNTNFSDLNDVDAIIIPGGADIHPKFYLKNVTEELRQYTEDNIHLAKITSESKQRDQFEYSLVKTYNHSDKYKNLPLLGICRGMQMMSVAQGIPLYLDIKTELGIPNRYYIFDKVHLSEGNTLMQSLYKRDTLKGYELHHQGIRVDYYKKNQSSYPNVSVTSYSNDELIAESLEYKHRPALGVQFHPELSFPNVTRPVFKWFLKKACENKKAKEL